MRRPEPLPPALHGRVFTRQEAVDAGLSPERLRRRDIERVGRGRYRAVALSPRPPLREGPTASALSPRDHARRRRRATQRSAARVLDEVPDAVASHTTAALIHGWWLPWRVEADPTVHVNRPAARHRVDRAADRAHLYRPGVRTHRMELPPEHIALLRGRRVTAVERTWLDCATLLTVEELVILGDTLVREPHSWAEPDAVPWSTPQRLKALVSPARRRPGVVAARAALELIRIGSDSPKESRLRLAILAAGLPEPTLQVECWDPEYSLHIPATADLGYPDLRIAIQYEGEHHGGAEQMRRDLRRDQAFIRQGWIVLRFGSADAAEGFREAVSLIRGARATRRRPQRAA